MEESKELVPEKQKRLTYNELMERIEKKHLITRETIVVEKDAWGDVIQFMRDQEQEIRNLEFKTPVVGAYGACTTLGCMWNQLERNKAQYEKQRAAFQGLIELVVRSQRLLDELAEKKLAVVEDWWQQRLEQSRRDLEDMTRLII